MKGIIWITMSITLLQSFGALYAIFICVRPFKPTHLEVVVGCGATLLGATALGYGLHLAGLPVGSILAAPWIAFALTGTPMIVGQVIKIRLYEQQAIQELEDCSDGNST